MREKILKLSIVDEVCLYLHRGKGTEREERLEYEPSMSKSNATQEDSYRRKNTYKCGTFLRSKHMSKAFKLLYETDKSLFEFKMYIQIYQVCVAQKSHTC